MNAKANADAVAAAMYDKGMGAVELAERAQVSTNTVYRLARGQGNVSPRSVKAVADVLGVRPSSLIAL